MKKRAMTLSFFWVGNLVLVILFGLLAGCPRKHRERGMTAPVNPPAIVLNVANGADLRAKVTGLTVTVADQASGAVVDAQTFADPTFPLNLSINVTIPPCVYTITAMAVLRDGSSNSDSASVDACAFAGSAITLRIVTEEPTPIPTSTATPPALPTGTPVATVPPAPTATPTVPPAPTETPTVPPAPTETPTVPPVPTATPTVPPVPTATPTVPPAPTATPTVPPAPTETPTPTPQPIILYDGGTMTGNLSGITGADATCAASGIAPVGYATYRALLGSPTGGAINAFPVPAGVPVQSLSSQVIASDWASMFSSALLTNFLAAGVTTSSLWWSGSETDGTYILATTADCNAWTDGSASAWGNYGDATTTAVGTWVLSSNTTCDTTLSLVCVAY
jgi:hypothetical protein